MQDALNGLRSAERELTEHLESLRRVIRSIESGAEGGAAGRIPGRKRNLSAKGRAAIARAARKRWAAYRAAKARKRE
jgi:hypothetical protein